MAASVGDVNARAASRSKPPWRQCVGTVPQRFKEELELRLCTPQEVSECAYASQKDCVNTKTPLALLTTMKCNSGDGSTWNESAAPSGERQYKWKSPLYKGCIYLYLSSGHVVVQGSDILLSVVSDFTEPSTKPTSAMLMAMALVEARRKRDNCICRTIVISDSDDDGGRSRSRDRRGGGGS